jgi:hypothetical protein
MGCLENVWSLRNNFLVTGSAQFAGHGAEYASALGFFVGVDNDASVVVEADCAAILAVVC